MQKDPAYLQHLGQLATLKNFIGCAYYQTVWEDFKTDEDVWKAYTEHLDHESIQRLADQIDTLLTYPAEAIYQFLQETIGGGGLYFNTQNEAIDWLHQCRMYMKSILHSESG